MSKRDTIIYWTGFAIIMLTVVVRLIGLRVSRRATARA